MGSSQERNRRSCKPRRRGRVKPESGRARAQAEKGRGADAPAAGLRFQGNGEWRKAEAGGLTRGRLGAGWGGS